MLWSALALPADSLSTYYGPAAVAMLSRSLQSIARPSRAYVCLFCVTRSSEISTAARRPYSDLAPTQNEGPNSRVDGLFSSISPDATGDVEGGNSKPKKQKSKGVKASKQVSSEPCVPSELLLGLSMPIVKN